MKCKIDNDKTIGCDKISKAYCENYNALQPLIDADDNLGVLSNIQFRLDNMGGFDRAALGLYIGKFVEQEINSSIVQLMRYAIGIEMPDFYCKRDSCFGNDEVRNDNRCVRLNKQVDPRKHESLATISAGDAYYALKAMKNEYKYFFEKYRWLYEREFLDAWRKLFLFRNSVAHIGHLITQSELDQAFGYFEIFLKYMPNIKALKVELAPEGMFDEEKTESATFADKESNENHPKESATLPKATVEQYKRVSDLMEKLGRLTDIEREELNCLLNEFDWMTIIFTDENGRKGMRHINGKVLIPTLYEEIGLTFNCIDCNMNLVPAYKNGKCGLVKCDGTGAPVTDFIYDSIDSIPWIENAFLYKKDGSLSYGLLQADGIELSPCIIDKYYEPSNSCFIFKCGDYYGLWDLNEKVLMPMFDAIEVSEPTAPMIFTLNGIEGYLNENLEFVPKSNIDAIEDEDERLDKMQEFLPAEYDI